MSANFFVDTNVLIYLLAGREPAPGETLTRDELASNIKADAALNLLGGEAMFLSVQVFNEICNVVLRRRFNWKNAMELLSALESLCVEVLPITLDTHKRGLLLREKYKMQFFDALMVASALQAGCEIFYSEDMQHGQLIEGSLRIQNPFARDGQA
ncbi:PIN domain-containing protein [Pseudoduganella aquatica]|uniref:PIN domain-containing protein n=1 Tax=Pseudoduganella aquatica TaxID=2660641 RepID=UPI001E5940B2|nr:PIN domain-containing protein [Pseudoduganella aquatica]